MVLIVIGFGWTEQHFLPFFGVQLPVIVLVVAGDDLLGSLEILVLGFLFILSRLWLWACINAEAEGSQNQANDEGDPKHGFSLKGEFAGGELHILHEMVIGNNSFLWIASLHFLLLDGNAD